MNKMWKWIIKKYCREEECGFFTATIKKMHHRFLLKVPKSIMWLYTLPPTNTHSHIYRSTQANLRGVTDKCDIHTVWKSPFCMLWRDNSGLFKSLYCFCSFVYHSYLPQEHCILQVNCWYQGSIQWGLVTSRKGDWQGKKHAHHSCPNWQKWWMELET